MGSFETLGIPDQVLRNIRLAGYRVPTDIQAQAIPVLLQGMDAVISSETGSGKTAAFLIPGIVRYVEGRRRLLVLSPTRELAIQTDRQAGTLGRGLLRHALVYGGAPMGRQVSDLSMGPGIVTGTPGRVLDLHRRGAIDLGAFDSVVLDECDTMLDMGFVEDVTEILSHASGRSQTSFVSATVTAPILSLISELGTDPVYIGLRPGERHGGPAIEHTYAVVRPGGKFQALLEYIRHARPSRAIVFTGTRRYAGILAQRLNRHGVSALAIHGDMTQRARESAMEEFRRRPGVLVATDVASRGIDIKGIDAVVNFDVPRDPRLYVHRTGRTARMGAVGLALTIVESGEVGALEEIEREAGVRMMKVDLGAAAE
ncbi:hypothetical protein GCM10007108_07350 [Thermogymnomonas acidicola]|uniref:DEAD/DEAH box helicase n=1 Tax=Thermogymnomonas acidicola TaxID=399579 RepID=A0AA37F979_9ARCH|nr:DEAD/DEAH box helicase [Thermogymnomonas acidicola]GGM71769.1 hypothetical protein GCM10007108_07350 [Thermogymnomonas acidicola]